MQHLGYVVHVRSPGMIGGETRSYQVACALAEQGIEVDLYGKVSNSATWPENVRAHLLRKPTPIAVGQLLSDFSRYKVRVAIERFQFPPFNVAFFAQQIRAQPLILEVHGFPIDEYELITGGRSLYSGLITSSIMGLPRSIWEKLQALIFMKTSHFIVTSRGTESRLMQLGVSAEKISVIYNCVDPLLFDPATRDVSYCKEQFGFLPDQSIILYAGSLFHEELITVIDAAPMVLADHPGTRFVCFGANPNGSPLMARARELGLSRREFEIFPSLMHQRMPDLLAAADVVIAPYSLDSRRFAGGFYYSPLKLMEALSMNKPVVTVNADELMTVFGPVFNVQFANGGSAQSWADGLLSAIQMRNDPALAVGREFIMNGHRWRDAAQEYLEIIRHVAPDLR